MTDTPPPTIADAERLLQSIFNFPRFRSGQRDVISHLFSTPTTTPPTIPPTEHGRSLAIFPTGAGKSLCYQIPSLLFHDGLTLVVSPLIALMKDQVDSLRSRNQPAACLDSSLSASDTRDLFDAVRSADIKLLFVSPERFNNERFMRLLQSVRVALFAVDEAHCISEWGHSFRPDYLRLARWADRLNCQRRLALTATATPAVARDICTALAIPPAAVVRTPSLRPNLTTRVTAIPPASTALTSRVAMLASRIRERDPGPVIVYVTLQSTATRAAQMFRDMGLSQARSYHAGMRMDERKRVQDDFMANRHDALVVATIAFGMGMDHAGIRYVYHLNLPKSLEGYIQEIGRAGRDGLPATCETLASIDDLPLLEGFIYGETPSRTAVRALLDSLFTNAKQNEYIEYSTYDLTFEHDMRDTCLGQILAQLDISEHALEESTPFFSQLQCRLLPLSQRRDPPAGSMGARVLATGVRKTSNVYVDVKVSATELDLPYGRISRICDDLVRDGYLDAVNARKLTHRARVKAVPTDLDAVAGRLHGRLLCNEKRQLKRIGEVLAYLSANECQTAFLSRHLGDEVDDTGPCGHCEFCLNDCKQPITISEERRVRVGKTLDERKWAVVLAELDLPRNNPKLLARFAAGISSPVISRKFRKLRSFGSMSDHDFKTLLKAAERECNITHY